MARKGVTREAVETALHALKSAGLPTSIRKVREQLGDTGSLKTIAEHVRAIQVERWEGAGPALPDPLLQHLLKGAADYWADLAGAADDQIADVKAQAEASVATMTEALRAAEQAAQRVSDQLAAHQQTIRTLERHLSEKSSSVTTLTAKQTEQADQLITVIAERDTAIAQHQQAEHTNQGLTETVDDLKVRLDRVNEAATHAKEKHRLQESDLQAELTNLMVKSAQQTDALVQGEGVIATVRAQLEVAETAQSELMDAYQTLKLEHRELTTTHRSQSAQLESLQSSSQEIKQQQRQQQMTAEEMLVSQRDMIASLGQQLNTLVSREPTTITSDGVDKRIDPLAE